MALPERRYYPLDLAAKKAGCEVRDLFHFASIGLLEICARIESDKGKRSMRMHVNHFAENMEIEYLNIIGENQDGYIHFSLVNKRQTGFSVGDWQADRVYSEHFSDSFSMIFSLRSRNNFCELELSENKQTKEERFSFPRWGTFFLTGYKRPYTFEENEYESNEKSDSSYKADHNLCEFFHPISDIASAYITSNQEIEIPVSSLIITAKELELFMSGGKEIKDRPDINEEKKPHGNALKNAETRGEILAAARHIKKNFPDECKTYTDWAYTIEQKAGLFWPSGNPPLATGTIERLLSERANSDVE